jgi:uncharacterized protein (TIGR03437 family)
VGADAPRPWDAPIYTAASIVNAADNQSGTLAANTIATIYGTNLAYSTIGLTANDVRGGVLPIMLGTSETEVFVENYPADLYYVSPTQINFLVPPNLLPRPASVWVVIDGLRGPTIPVTIMPAAPALFQLDSQTAVATSLNGTVLTESSPAHPGDIVVLYATGLGATMPPAVYGQLPTAAAPLAPGANLQILLDGVAVDQGAILYAGIAPGNAGLYQINLTLPGSTGTNPQIQLMMGTAASIAGIHLPVAP